MSTFFLRVVASDKVFFSGHCQSLVIPLADGEKQILAHHENMIIAVDPGEMRLVDADEKTVTAVIGQGFLQIMNNRASLLVDTAERPEEIDLRRAQEAKERAEEQLRQKQSLAEHYHSEASLARALSRLKVKEKYL